jgi:hypothetical protein
MASVVILACFPVLFLAMLASAEIGRRIGITRREQETERERVGLIAIEGAIFGLIGLLIAFTFSGASSRFEARRVLVVQEANAIGTAYLRLDALPSSARPALREKFRAYADARWAVVHSLPDQDVSSTHASRAAVLQKEIWADAIAALLQASPQASLLLLPALNEMFDLAESRSIAVKTHTPAIIVVLLAVMAVLSAMLVGYVLAGGKPFSVTLHLFAFVFVMMATLYVIIDLDYPRHGLIRLDYSDQALADVRAGMEP